MYFIFCSDLDQLPGIIYGVDEVNPQAEYPPLEVDEKGYSHIRYDPRNIKIPIQVDIKLIEKELHRLGRRFESTCYELVLDDNSRHFVFPRQLQINPCKSCLVQLPWILQYHDLFCELCGN